MNSFKQPAVILAVLLSAFFIHACTDSSTGPDEDKQTFSRTTVPGNSAKAFLSDEQYTRLQLEIDYMEGYAPTPEAIDSLQDFLGRRLNKDLITINGTTSIPAKGQDSYTADEVRDLEEKYRDRFTENKDDNTLTAYIIILDGEHKSGSVVGVAYYNTSIALFGETIARISSSGITAPPREKIEGTVLMHEFGHLFGLVNIEGSGTEMQTPHQDEAHGNHCNNDQCLMYWAVETTDFFANLFEEEIPDLDQNCINDLRANGGK